MLTTYEMDGNNCYSKMVVTKFDHLKNLPPGIP